MKEWLIKIILAALFRVTADQWKTVCGWVASAGENFLEGHLKNKWVREQVAAWWPQLKPAAVDAVVGLAVGWQQKLGKS